MGTYLSPNPARANLQLVLAKGLASKGSAHELQFHANEGAQPSRPGAAADQIKKEATGPNQVRRAL